MNACIRLGYFHERIPLNPFVFRKESGNLSSPSVILANTDAGRREGKSHNHDGGSGEMGQTDRPFGRSRIIWFSAILLSTFLPTELHTSSFFWPRSPFSLDHSFGRGVLRPHRKDGVALELIQRGTSVLPIRGSCRCCECFS